MSGHIFQLNSHNHYFFISYTFPVIFGVDFDFLLVLITFLYVYDVGCFLRRIGDGASICLLSWKSLGSGKDDSALDKVNSSAFEFTIITNLLRFMSFCFSKSMLECGFFRQLPPVDFLAACEIELDVPEGTIILLLIFFILKFVTSFLCIFSVSFNFRSNSCYTNFRASFLLIFSTLLFWSPSVLALCIYLTGEVSYLERFAATLLVSKFSLSSFFLCEKTSYCAISTFDGTLRLTRIAPLESVWPELFSKWCGISVFWLRLGETCLRGCRMGMYATEF